MTGRSPAPWSFYEHRFGLKNVVVDAEGRMVVIQCAIGNGPLLAAAPTLLQALARVAAVAPAGSEARAIAETAIENFTEREGMLLADWRANRPPPTLRIVGSAS